MPTVEMLVLSESLMVNDTSGQLEPPEEPPVPLPPLPVAPPVAGLPPTQTPP
jgi:hypothetical protein